jgi:hypothetical protein
VKPYLEDLDEIEAEMNNEQEDVETPAEQLEPEELEETIEFSVTINPHQLLSKSYRQAKIDAAARQLESVFDSIADAYGIKRPELSPEVKELWRNYNEIQHYISGVQYRQRQFEQERKRKEEAERERKQEQWRAEIDRKQKAEWQKRQDEGIEAYRKALNNPESEHYAYVASMPYQVDNDDTVEYLRRIPWMPEAHDQISDDEEMLIRFLDEVISKVPILIDFEGGFIGKDAHKPTPEEVARVRAFRSFRR